jgi:purine nucleoside phosphorylase
MARDGCDTVGMTGMPEAALARELGMRYAAINVVVNPAAGVGSSAHQISLDAIKSVMGEAMQKVKLVLQAAAGTN